MITATFTSANAPSALRSLLPLQLAGFLSALAYSYLCLNSQYEGQLELPQLWASVGLSALLCFLSWAYYRHTELNRWALGSLIFWAVVFRGIGVLSFPAMEDDFYRYLWDGRMVAAMASPYQQAPAEFFNTEGLTDAWQSILSGINYPESKTVYGPVNQYLFALAHYMAPAEVWPLQLIMALFDMLLIAVLLLLYRNWNVLLYAWCPLVVKEFAFTAHPDVAALLAVVLALLLVGRNYVYWAAAAMAVAVMAKIFALILLPFILRRHWCAYGLFILLCLCLGFPLTGAQLPQGLMAMAGGWQFNAPLHQLLSQWFDFNGVKLFLLLVFSSCWAGLLYRFMRLDDRGELTDGWVAALDADRLFALMLLCAPVINPWYVTWVLVFAVFKPSFWAWTLSFSVFLAYASGINLTDSELGLYQQPLWAISLEYGLVLVALGGDIIVRTKLNFRLRPRAKTD